MQNKSREKEFIDFLEYLKFQDTFWNAHRDRYIESGNAVSTALDLCAGRSAALEIGASFVFAEWLKNFNFDKVEVTDYNKDVAVRKRVVRSSFSDLTNSSFVAYNIDLESDVFPCNDGVFDLIVCFEVIEHMDVDPAFFMGEINRILKHDGILVLSTPNSTSSQIVQAVLTGYAPQLYMVYQRDRSPFRHNFEYSPEQIKTLMTSSGLEIDKFWTKDTFNPPSQQALNLLAAHFYPTVDRGDNIFLIARKTSGVIDRYPPGIYEHRW